MSEKKQAIVIDPRDNVATAIQDLEAGDIVKIAFGEITLLCDIPFGHKFALTDIRQGEYLIKYGAPIGRAIRFIPKGGHVHVHNVEEIIDKVQGGG